MKNLSKIITITCFTILTCFSCEEEKSTSSIVEPDAESYIVGINLGVETPLTKGVTSSGAFDTTYESDVIYLHKKTTDGEEEVVMEIPVYNYECHDPNFNESQHPDGRCNGFRYQVQHNNDGTITLTPINSRGDLIIESSITVSGSDEFYFSSYPTRYWEIKNKNINANFEAPDGSTYDNNELYTRDPEVNKEIYRSYSDYTLNEVLNLNGDLTMERKCSGFSFMALFRNPSSGSLSILTESDFERIMGDSYQNWYIKIYLGSMFTSKYDMQEESGIQQKGGFYGSTDVTKYNEGIDDGYYLPFRHPVQQGGTISGGGSSSVTIGMGYQSVNDLENNISNLLIAPTNENFSQDLDMFVFIKHWDGEEGTTPDEAWLTSNDNAIYTKVTGERVINVDVQDGIFYECGISIDINELKAAAEANGLINYSSTTTTKTSRSLHMHGNKPKKLTLHNAETFIRY